MADRQNATSNAPPSVPPDYDTAVGNSTGPRLPPLAPRVLANVGRPPLERAFSVPERGFGGHGGIPPHCGSGSRSSMENKGYGSKDRMAARRPSLGSTDKFLIPVDENNIPTIDAAITPSSSPVRDVSSSRIASSFAPSGKVIKRFPSLKLKHRTRVGSEPDHDIDESSDLGELNPTITVTMDEDQISMVSDYLSPDHNYTKRDSKIHYIGDDVSLYGTPKEELSPLKEVESKTSASTSYLKDQIIAFFQPSDNKLAMKLFGNKNALMKEKMRQKAAGNWVIHPCSNFR